ncbi:hypothetical protein [Demequina sp.]|uniref:hypothetical protein n=1 Tax=Demequina sp. TaxID=2050685 RepID=UPI0025C5CDA3|nr:hypothetical protein [Demequina sp.]
MASTQPRSIQVRARLAWVGLACALPLLASCASSSGAGTGTGAPELFGDWIDLKRTGARISLDPNGTATVADVEIAPAGDCDPARLERVTASGEWFVDDHNFVVVSVPEGEIVLIPSQRFGIADWEAFFAGPCGHGTAKGMWVEFIGGDHSATSGQQSPGD